MGGMGCCWVVLGLLLLLLLMMLLLLKMSLLELLGIGAI